MTVYLIDENGFIVETYTSNYPFEADPDYLVTKGWDCRLFKPKFVDGEWVEGLTEEELEQREREVEEQRLSEIDRLKTELEALKDMINP